MSLNSNQVGIIVAGLLFVGSAFYLLSRTKKPEGPIKEEAIVQVQRSWEKVKQLGYENVGALLFKNIFEASPETLNMFRFKNEPNMYESKAYKAHGRNVVYTVGVAVAGLRNLENMVTPLKDLGLIHEQMGYGIGKAHYDLVGQMLLKTLKQGLGPDYTPEVEKAWLEVYTVVAQTMMAGAQEGKK